MFQPFLSFEERYIDRLIKLNKRYLVSQAYSRAFNHFDAPGKIALLMSDYADLGLAEIHYKAVRKENDKTVNNDEFAAIIDLSKEKHRVKLISMLQADSKYKVYWAVVKSAKETQELLNFKYSDKVRRWIMANTNWRIGGAEKVSNRMMVIFGEIFINLKYKTQEYKVKFTDIEKA